MRPSQAVVQYIQHLIVSVGNGWNRFWFKPADPAPLGALRVAVGLLAIYSHVVYTFDLVAWFGPNGLFPATAVAAMRETSFSYLDYISSPSELFAVHFAGLAVLVLFTIGLWSRVTSILSLVVVLSYFHRAPMVTGLFEPVLAFLMLYLCIGPSGAFFSVDAWRKRKANSLATVTPSLWAAISLRMIQVHLTVAYLMSAISKIAEPGQEWASGRAAWVILARADSRLVDLTGVLATHPYLVNFWTHSILLFELLFGIFVWNKLARPLMLAIAIPMWLSLALITGDMMYSLTMLAANLAFFSPKFVRICLRGDDLAPRQIA